MAKTKRIVVLVEEDQHATWLESAGGKRKLSAWIRAQCERQYAMSGPMERIVNLGVRGSPSSAVQKEVEKAIVHGQLKKLPCEVCGSVYVIAHHYDYETPLVVIWMCRSCHGKAHWLMWELGTATKPEDWLPPDPGSIRTSITDQVREIMRRRGWKAKDLAAVLGGANAEAVSKKLANSRPWTIPDLEKIADATGETIEIEPERREDDG